MNLIRLLSIFLGTVFIIACSNSEGGSDNTASKIEVSVEKVGDTLNPRDIKVKHKQDVTIKIKSDSDGTFHIHGYNLEKDLKSGEISEINLAADATGRFPIGFHLSDSKSEHGHEEHGHEEHGHEEHGHEEHNKCTYQFPLGSPDTPVITINTTEGQNPGSLIINTNITNFKLASKPEEKDDHSNHNMEMQEDKNIGHWHLYINNELKGMYYDETATIEGLDSGEYVIKVVLSSLTHCEYDITSETTIKIEDDLNKKDHHDHNAGNDDHKETIIGNFIVEPN